MFRVALRLGMTVRQLTREASAREIMEWISFLEYEESDRADWQRTALLASTMVNVSRIIGMGKVPKTAKMEDFMPPDRTPKKRQTPEEQREILRQLFGSGAKKR